MLRVKVSAEAEIRDRGTPDWAVEALFIATMTGGVLMRVVVTVESKLEVVAVLDLGEGTLCINMMWNASLPVLETDVSIVFANSKRLRHF